MVRQLSSGSLRRRATSKPGDVAAEQLRVETHGVSGQLFSAQLGGGAPAIPNPRKEAQSVRYYFVLADARRGTDRETLPALQGMLDDEEMKEWIVEKEMNFDDACRGKYADEYLTVSHRWLTDQVQGEAAKKRAPPDPNGVQLAAIREHLAARPKVKYVWLDWFCMWQADKEGERDINVDERTEFGRCALDRILIPCCPRSVAGLFAEHVRLTSPPSRPHHTYSLNSDVAPGIIRC